MMKTWKGLLLTFMLAAVTLLAVVPASSVSALMSYTRATLQRSGALAGQLDVVTRTKNNVKLTGFTGGVFLLLRTADGAVIGVTDQQKFGVDGQWIGRYDRTDYWSWSFNPEVASAMPTSKSFNDILRKRWMTSWPTGKVRYAAT
ncbi:hypothetical protein [Paenibacillus sp. LHD-38]|uniref:hypothetical protein n=1 Tax=Paenibacillus sp. LHD-38 TaxID=3072143 RepID=UPI00280F9E4A|nr:hypothetical protein [Paenibacillus sp. LHD-38]MDQ8739521.1 hypothetical protein [Paenibacillus sp. LHD-38]